MVGTTGIEPVTTAMSRQCSTAELRAPIKLNLTSNHQGRARYQKDGGGVKCYRLQPGNMGSESSARVVTLALDSDPTGYGIMNP